MSRKQTICNKVPISFLHFIDDDNTTHVPAILIIIIVSVCIIVLALFGLLVYCCLKKCGKCSNILRRRHQVHNGEADQVDSANRISLLGPVYKTHPLFDHNTSHKTSLASLGSRCILDVSIFSCLLQLPVWTYFHFSKFNLGSKRSRVWRRCAWTEKFDRKRGSDERR